jgi:hypothetical protein
LPRTQRAVCWEEWFIWVLFKTHCKLSGAGTLCREGDVQFCHCR